MKIFNTLNFFTAPIFILIFSSISYSQLSGIYTIGAGGDFTTITSAVSSLNNVGVSGPVTFKLKTGTYDEIVMIDSIKGTSTAKTVVFESESGNNADVTWGWIMANANTITLSRPDNLIFRNLTLKNGTTSSFPGNNTIVISGNCDNIKIQNCNVIAYWGYSISSSANHKNLLIDSNEINSYYGVSLMSASKSYSTKFINNTANIQMRGIKIINHDSLTVEKNTINSYNCGLICEGSTGLSLNTCNGPLKVLKNKISSQGNRIVTVICFELTNCSGNNSLIANNFFMTGVGDVFKVSNSNNQKIYYNTIYAGSILSTTFNINNSSLINSKNNIIICRSDNYGNHPSYSFGLNASTITSDYNRFFYFGPELGIYNGTHLTDIQHLRNISGNEINSTTGEVFFVAPPDLHLDSTSIGDESLIGIPLADVTDDIDGYPRDLDYPTMGADEPDFTNVISVDLTMLIEGFYNSLTNAQIPDTVNAYLRSAISPYSVVDSSKVKIRSDGTCELRFYNAVSGTYYIVINHRNSIETWSKAGGESLTFGLATPYDFTNSFSKAYGNNLTYKGTRYCIYSGDVNKDGIIDGTDTQLIDNAAFNFISGYINPDVDGNNFVDGSDAVISDNNAFNFVSVMRP